MAGVVVEDSFLGVSSMTGYILYFLNPVDSQRLFYKG